MAGETRYLGLNREPSFGTAADALFYLDFLSANLEAPSEPLVFYEGAGSRGQVVSIPGPYIPSGDIEVGIDPVDAIHLILWSLGRYGVEGSAKTAGGSTTLSQAASRGDTTIKVASKTGLAVDDYIQVGAGIGGDTVKVTAIDGTASPYTLTVALGLLNDHADSTAVKEMQTPFKHVFRPTLDDVLPSFTARIGKGLFEHVFSGATINSIGFSVEQGFLVASASILAQKDAQVALNSSPKRFPTNMFTFRQGTTAIANVDRTSLVQSFSVQWTNNIDESGSVRHGSRFPRKFNTQGVDVTGSLQLAFEDMNEYTRFWGDAAGTREAGADPFKLEQSYVAGADKLRFVLGSALWTQVSTPVSGRGRITQEASFKSVVDSQWDIITVEMTSGKERYAG